MVRSGWFRERVRQRIIAEVEAATGGRVEVGNFYFKWETLVAKISPLVLHGMEPASETPLLRVESVSVGLRVISMLERKVDLSFLTLDQPRVRIVIYPDGSNNLPTPAGKSSGKSWAQNLVDLAVRRYAVTNGMAEIDLRKIPLNINGEDLRVQMTRATGAARYRGNVTSRHVRVASDIMAPAEADLAAAFTLDANRLALVRGPNRRGRLAHRSSGRAYQSARSPRRLQGQGCHCGSRRGVAIFGTDRGQRHGQFRRRSEFLF